MTQRFKAVPNKIIEAAQLNGRNTLSVIFKIIVPMCKSGLVCTALLSVLGGWNMYYPPFYRPAIGNAPGHQHSKLRDYLGEFEIMLS